MVATTFAESGQTSRQAVSAAVVGNVLEWYDFAVYGFMAGIIGKNFFPSTDELTSLLASFAEPFSFQLLRHLGACWGWVAFLSGGARWGRQTRTALPALDRAGAA